MTEQRLPQLIKDKVQKMMLEDGWKLNEVTPKDAIWGLVAEDEFRRKIVVGQKVKREDELIIQGSVKIDEGMTKTINNLSEDERNKFLWDLRFELLRTNCEFSGIEIPLKLVNVTERICFDALTKDAFLQRASEVRKGLLIVLWMLARRFRQSPPPRQLGFLK